MSCEICKSEKTNWNCALCIKRYRKNYRGGRIQKERESSRKYYAEHRVEARRKQNKYRADNHQLVLEQNKIYRKKNKEKRNAARRESYKNNKERDNKNAREYKRRRRASDPIFKLKNNFSNNIRKSLKGRKNVSCWDILDYTLEELKIHLENQFDDKMTWENQGTYWHIDHIKPISSFQIKEIGDNEFKKCWALENLQPLEAKENIIKGARLNWIK